MAQARSLRQATPQAAATILRELDLSSRQIQDTLRSQLSDNSLSPLEINRMRLGLLSVDAEQLEPIAEFVLSASGQRLKPDELLLIRDVLTPHGTDLAARFPAISAECIGPSACRVFSGRLRSGRRLLA